MRRFPKIAENHHGFSLIELLFAIVFVSVIIFGVIRLQTSNLALTSTQNNELQAHFWANQGMQIVEAIDPDFDSTCTGVPKFPCILYLDLDASGDPYTIDEGNPLEVIDILFERHILVETDAKIPNAYKVQSIVEWEDSTGPHSVEAKRIL